jgi:hypothetical protein
MYCTLDDDVKSQLGVLNLMSVVECCKWKVVEDKRGEMLVRENITSMLTKKFECQLK